MGVVLPSTSVIVGYIIVGRPEAEPFRAAEHGLDAGDADGNGSHKSLARGPARSDREHGDGLERVLGAQDCCDDDEDAGAKEGEEHDATLDGDLGLEDDGDGDCDDDEIGAGVEEAD